MAYSHDWESEGVHLKFWGATSGEEIDTAIGFIRNHSGLSRLKYAIADYLGVDEFCVTPYHALLIAAHDHWAKDTNAGLRIALVGNRADVLEAFRLYSESAVIKDFFEVRTFAALDEARNWAVCS